LYFTADNAAATASCISVDATLTGVNLSATQTWDVSAAFSASNASNSITCQEAKKVG
jgi:hypothetical protein